MAFINAINKTFTLANGQVLVGTGTNSANTIGLDVGQILIGKGLTTAPSAATLTAGSGITINNASGAITISSAAVAPAWNTVSSNTTAVGGQNYVVAGTQTVTLPTPALGVPLQFVGPAGGYILQAPAGVTIQMGAVTGAAAGSATSQGPGDSVLLIGTSATNWIAASIVGTFNLV